MAGTKIHANLDTWLNGHRPIPRRTPGRCRRLSRMSSSPGAGRLTLPPSDG